TKDGYTVSLTHLGSLVAYTAQSVDEAAPVATIGPSGVPEFDVPYLHLGIRLTADGDGYVDPLSLLPPRVPAPPPAPPPPSEPTAGVVSPAPQPAATQPAVQAPAPVPAPVHPAQAGAGSTYPAPAETPDPGRGPADPRPGKRIGARSPANVGAPPASEHARPRPSALRLPAGPRAPSGISA